ncbi:MAG: hypothetical protein M0R17_11005 [Candidatus Omnitrophica bacterium]|jgi:hypothetical protein|nr:hypothetical protein [Candidatus Omnitrophota bacterium]
MDYQQENYQDNYNGYSGNQEPSDSFLKAMIEVEETLNKFEMETLRRKRLHVDLKNKSKTWIPMAKGVNPICNELGISELLGVLRGRATVVGRLTKKTDIQVMSDMFQFDRMLTDLIAKRADDWDLDEDLVKSLKESCLSLIEDIIFSSINGFTAMNLRSSYSRSETSNTTLDNPITQKRGILGLK